MEVLVQRLRWLKCEKKYSKITFVVFIFTSNDKILVGVGVGHSSSLGVTVGPTVGSIVGSAVGVAIGSAVGSIGWEVTLTQM